ncbi:hypothetical protein [Kitasatospora sp. NPDC056531]|uniref:hypothetical protein n=1 Tax=Kitasatospora sp. NPDC056531 TaxID=3345856 RepID=UPI0036742FE4
MVALDRDKRPVDSIASNLGHLLGTGLLDAEESVLVARRLTAPGMDSGFGLRTLDAAAAGFNPLGSTTPARSGRTTAPSPCTAWPAQAWAAASAVLVLQALLGLEADAPNRRLRVRAQLPAGYESLRISGLTVAGLPIEAATDHTGAVRLRAPQGYTVTTVG